MRNEVLCPRCGVPMVAAVGVPGAWQCPNRRDHEFMEDPADEEELDDDPRPKKRGRTGSNPDPPTERCPQCKRPMKSDDLGRFCDSAVHKGVYRPPKEDQPYWLSHLGIKAPLQDVRQSNITDGSACLLLGPLGKGGGSKSGRKRRKPPKSSRGGPMSGYYDT